VDALTRLLAALGESGGTACAAALAVRLDLLRSVGPGYARQRLRLGRELGVLQDYRRSLYRSIWADAALELGATMSDTDGEFIEIRSGSRSTRVLEHVTTLNSELALELCSDKAETSRLLTKNGLPVPEYLQFDYRNHEPAARFLRRTPGPCVVKPLRQDGGLGITTSVRTATQLRRAILRAAEFDRTMVIERQAAGHVYRVLILDGELLDVVKRSPPHVVGTGHASIATLVVGETLRRLHAGGRAGISPLLLDLDALFTLDHAGLRPGSVPGDGERVLVKTVTNQNAAEENVTFHGMSDEVVTAAIKAVATVGLRLGGVDIVTSDPTKPLADTNGVILEVNRPGLHHQYLVAKPDEATRVTIPILHTLLAA
jgi:cyanophycin synthetase